MSTKKNHGRPIHVLAAWMLTQFGKMHALAKLKMDQSQMYAIENGIRAPRRDRRAREMAIYKANTHVPGDKLATKAARGQLGL